MENPETYKECVNKVESEVTQEDQNEHKLRDEKHHIKVEIERVKEEHESEDEILPPAQVTIGEIKNEAASDEEELEPPAKVTVEDFKGDIVEGYYANILSASSALQTSSSLSRPQTSLQLQWKDGEPVLPAHIASQSESWVDNKGCVAITGGAPAGSAWISTDGQTFSDGTLVKDSNVQYVLMTSADSFYVLENPENNAVCTNDASIKNIIAGDKNIQVISIVPNQGTASGNVVIGSLTGEALEGMREPEREEKPMIVASSSNKRSNEPVNSFPADIQAQACDVQLLQRKKKGTGTVAEEGGSEALKKGCDVNSCAMRCSAVFDENERREIHKNFHSLSAEEQRRFVLASCTRKTFFKRVKVLVGSPPQTNWKYDFQLKSSKGIPVQVCRLFFIRTLGFDEIFFTSYLSDLFKNEDPAVYTTVKSPNVVVTRCTCPTGSNQRYRSKSNVKWFGTCKLHSDVYCHADKELFHNHIESFLRTLCIPQGELVRTVRYLPKDVSIDMMYHDFSRKYPGVHSSYELYKSFVVHFTS